MTRSAPHRSASHAAIVRPLLSCRGMRRCSVLVPRSASHESIGPGTAPPAFWMNVRRSARVSSFTIAMPPIMSLCPFRYFVVE